MLEIIIAITSLLAITLQVIKELKRMRTGSKVKAIARTAWATIKKYPIIPFLLGGVIARLFWK